MAGSVDQSPVVVGDVGVGGVDRVEQVLIVGAGNGHVSVPVGGDVDLAVQGVDQQGAGGVVALLVERAGAGEELQTEREYCAPGVVVDGNVEGFQLLCDGALLGADFAHTSVELVLVPVGVSDEIDGGVFLSA
ncbi:hypothetical protein AB5J62_05280 [Amycolatopsis sp. cg5]|uniref:hypothetical protein n=1 Tax=Amycolatopsis sp. cg5 TaxID=3238802 RepID=UPI00352370BF